MNKKRVVAIAGLLALLIGAWSLSVHLGGSSEFSFPLDERDVVESWEFNGAYTGNEALEAKSKAYILELEESIGKNEYPDYQVYIGIAGQYELLGDGRSMYDNLKKALAIDSQRTGLAWHNMGVLLARVGAKYTASTAYSRAVEAESGVMTYHTARLAFLVDMFPEDETLIETAFSEADNYFGDAVSILQIRAYWYADNAKYTKAIDTWKKIRALSPDTSHAGIDKEIEKLSSKS